MRQRTIAKLGSIVTVAFVLSVLSKAAAQGFSPIIEFQVDHLIFPGTPHLDMNGDTVEVKLDVFYHIPENPEGVIYFFHGSGGGARVWLIKVEQPLLLQDAVDRGFGVVSMESNNRNGKVWAVSTDSAGNEVGRKDNVDTDHVWQVHNDYMIANNKYSEGVPLFACGFSNGGAFTSRMGLRASTEIISNQDAIPDVSNVVPFRAVAIYGALGAYTRGSIYDTPTIFNVGINDNKVAPYPDMTDHPDWPYEPDRTVEYHFNNLATRGIDTEMNVKLQEPLQLDRFERIPGIDSVGSVAIYDSLKAASGPNGEMFLDANDSLLFNPRKFSVLPFIPSQFTNLSEEIDQQLVTVYAEHVVMSDFKDNTVDFFEKYINLTDVTASSDLSRPETYLLHQNYPNPFNPSTTITYSVGRADKVALRIYNALGQLIRTLVQGNQPAGEYSVVWDGKDDSGRPVASGSYFYQLKTGDFKSTRKMVLLQ